MKFFPKVDFVDEDDSIFMNKFKKDLESNIHLLENDPEFESLGEKNEIDVKDRNQIKIISKLISDERKREIQALALEMAKNNDFEER